MAFCSPVVPLENKFANTWLSGSFISTGWKVWGSTLSPWNIFSNNSSSRDNIFGFLDISSQFKAFSTTGRFCGCVTIHWGSTRRKFCRSSSAKTIKELHNVELVFKGLAALLCSLSMFTFLIATLARLAEKGLPLSRLIILYEEYSNYS